MDAYLLRDLQKLVGSYLGPVCIQIWTLTGTGTGNGNGTGGSAFCPHGMAIDHLSGLCYVTDKRRGVVQIFDTRHSKAGADSKDLAAPQRSSAFVQSFGYFGAEAAKFDSPSSVAVDGAGACLLVASNHAISTFTLDGLLLRHFRVTYPQSILVVDHQLQQQHHPQPLQQRPGGLRRLSTTRVTCACVSDCGRRELTSFPHGVEGLVPPGRADS